MIYVRDIHGRLQQVLPWQEGQTTALDLSDLPASIYVVTIESGERILYRQKVVKQ
ncbi:MAG: T9SS type A sorting domain-containing protein [Saprospiraceae bacterium]|nr:T9SS type A sorting domain-containing protein [Saprospiraceae bacterium]